MIRKISFFFELKATLTVTSTCQIMLSSLPSLGRQKISNSSSRTNGCIQDEDTMQTFGFPFLRSNLSSPGFFVYLFRSKLLCSKVILTSIIFTVSNV